MAVLNSWRSLLPVAHHTLLWIKTLTILILSIFLDICQTLSSNQEYLFNDCLRLLSRESAARVKGLMQIVFFWELIPGERSEGVGRMRGERRKAHARCSFSKSLLWAVGLYSDLAANGFLSKLSPQGGEAGTLISGVMSSLLWGSTHPLHVWIACMCGQRMLHGVRKG